MSFIDESVRVLKLTRKPRKEEFMMIAKITGIGMILIGLMGTIILIIGSFLRL